MGGLALSRLGNSAGAAPDDAELAAVVGQTNPRRRGPGPLYWSTYGYNNAMNAAMPEDLWKTNVDWVADTFAPYGYRMVCTDGWCDKTKVVTEHGYIRSFQDDWVHDWAWWAKYLKSRGLELGVYYNPLWTTRSTVADASVTVVGRPDIKVADIVNPGDYQSAGSDLWWVDVTRDGAEEYVKGYVEYFRQLGASFLRVDFLAWYELGFDQSEGTMCPAHGRENYVKALAWMRQAAGDMQVSLVMPNLFDHGAAERQYGDLIRIDNDASFGTWYILSEGPQTWQPIWSQWNNPFLGFTGFSDISGAGQVILDGDPVAISSYGNDGERETAISLFTMAGAALAISDRVDTIGNNARFFQNEEVLAVHRAGLVGKPIYHSTHPFSVDPTSRDPERWIGQLPDGSWVIGLFNRSQGPATKTIDFASELGLSGPAPARDLWAHRDLGPMTAWTVALAPHACSLITVSPTGPAIYQSEVGAWTGAARFENTESGFTGLGYVTGLDTAGAGLSVVVSAKKSGRQTLACRVANATGADSSLTVTATDPDSGHHIETVSLKVPSAPSWAMWRTVKVEIELGAGANMVTLAHTATDQGSINVDRLTLA
jgi:glucan 1,6-alpha-isomaltosidase